MVVGQCIYSEASLLQSPMRLATDLAALQPAVLGGWLLQTEALWGIVPITVCGDRNVRCVNKCADDASWPMNMV